MIKTTECKERDVEMRRKLYGNNIEATCEFCVNGRRSSDGKAILCPKKGVMPLYHHCRKFVYDPLKRIPKRPPEIGNYKKEDFKIEID
jgi:hypothetical protein